MSHSRPFVMRVLEEAFKNPEKAKDIRDTTIETLIERPGSASRIFDKFPCLLPDETMEYFSKKCIDILSTMEVHSITYDPNGIQIHNAKDQENISLFIKEIASLAIKELLDHQGHINLALIQLLGWENLKNQLNQSELIISILCGYVGAINQEIVVRFPKEVLALNPAYTGFTGYLNKKVPNKDYYETNVRQWVVDTLTKEGCIFNITTQKNIENKENKEKKPDIYTLLKWPNNSPTTSSLMVVSAINEASARMFFKKKTFNDPFLKIDGMKRNNLP